MISLTTVKDHLRVEHKLEDAKIQGYTDAAISAFEVWTNRTLVAEDDPLPDPVGNAVKMNKSIEVGALMLIGHWYANPEAVVVGPSSTDLPMATTALWMPHRWMNI